MGNCANMMEFVFIKIGNGGGNDDLRKHSSMDIVIINNIPGTVPGVS